MRRTLALALLLTALAPSFALAQTATFRLLPALPGRQSSTSVTHVSDDGGVIAGNAFMWSRCLQCCCTTPGFNSQAFRQAGEQALQLVPKLPGVSGDPFNRATALSGDGSKLYGWWRSHGSSPGSSGGFRFQNGQVASLSTWGGQIPTDASFDASTLLYPTAVGTPQGVTPLPPLQSGDAREARDLSPDTHIAAGTVHHFPDYRHAAIWTDHVLALLPAPEGFPRGVSNAVSDDGAVVVGTASAESLDPDPDWWGKAILWVDGMPHRLVDEAVYSEAAGYHPVQSALDVSGDGRIVLLRLRRNDAYEEYEAFLWDEANGLRRVRDILRFDFGLPEGPRQGDVGALSRDGHTIVGGQASGPDVMQGWVATIPDGCANGLDDDGDGSVDLADPGCFDAGDYSERGPGNPCDDGVDQDRDDLADFPGDPSCPSPSHPLESNCADGADNDFDGLADFTDPGCTDSEDLFETNPAAPCDDEQDNDGDTSTDLVDLGCDDPADPSEQSPYLACDDGEDNDGDGFADWLDEGCGIQGPSESPACSDGIDNDGDGLVDYLEDPECWEQPWRVRERPGACGFGVELAAIVPALYWLRSRRTRSSIR
jgi:uncharacterized membrane protein